VFALVTALRGHFGATFSDDTTTRIRQEDTMKTAKFCNGCAQVFPVVRFRRHKGHGDGYDSRCKRCMRRDDAKKPSRTEYMRAWRAAHPGYMQAWYARRKEATQLPR
jgi:hypothetical protein